MAKTIKALITPEVLSWARQLDRLTIDEVSVKLKVDIEKIKAWESGDAYPSMVQAKKLANIYRVPFAYFYLPDIPKRKVKRIESVDYRTFGNAGGVFPPSRELRWLLRDIQDRRDVMLDLYALEERTPIAFKDSLPSDSPAEEIANKIRAVLSLTDDIQGKFRKPEKALAYCIDQLEKRDFLIFQASKIDAHEMRGLSICYEQMPIIVLNRKDEYSARLFTLMHELAHIIIKDSGICTDVSERSQNTSPVERLCNAAAGLAIVPLQALAHNKAIRAMEQYGFDDSYVYSIARDFATSREVIIHRLLDMQKLTPIQYSELLERYSKEYAVYAAKKEKGFLPPHMDKGTQVGKLYAKTVLSAYRSDRISTRDASAYLLNLGAKHFSKVERWCY